MSTCDQRVTEALHLLSSGRRAEAVAAMRGAGEAGCAAALFELAIWSLAGDPVPRDLVAARVLLRRARLAGDADAGLMEASLTATGTGAPPNWADARALLETLAEASPAARRQTDLLGRMDLDEAGAPARTVVGEPLDEKGVVTRFSRLLTADECAHIATVGSFVLMPALVADPATGRQVPHPIRTSDGGVIGPLREDLVVRALNRRIAAISDTDVAQGEALTVLRYRPGQEYRMHFDTLPATANQRAVTVLIYLNQGFSGGETVFPELGLSITPRGGDAIVYRNILDNGRPDPRTRHAGAPVKNGEKWLATRWIRARPFDVWTGPEVTA